MRAASSARIPHCSVHSTRMVSQGRGEWVCPTCFTDFLNQGKQLDGEVLTYEQILPNRRARRAVMA